MPGNISELKSGKLLHIQEIRAWQGDEVHGRTVRALGRIRTAEVQRDKIIIEYQNHSILVDVKLLDREYFKHFAYGRLLQFFGEVHTECHRTCIIARSCRDMSSLDTDMFDRCLKIRRDFERVILSKTIANTLRHQE